MNARTYHRALGACKGTFKHRREIKRILYIYLSLPVLERYTSSYSFFRQCMHVPHITSIVKMSSLLQQGAAHIALYKSRSRRPGVGRPSLRQRRRKRAHFSRSLWDPCACVPPVERPTECRGAWRRTGEPGARTVERCLCAFRAHADRNVTIRACE